MVIIHTDELLETWYYGKLITLINITYETSYDPHFADDEIKHQRI